MEHDLIYGGLATVEELDRLNQLGYEFVIEDGAITQIVTVNGCL